MEFTIPIQNLKCSGCAHTIVSKVSAITNITNVVVDMDRLSVKGQAMYADDIENVKIKLAAIGYPEEGMANSLVSKAKSYVSCATGKISS
jgi:copper chaperone CopZ